MISMLDLHKCCDFFDNNIGRRVVMNIKRALTPQAKKEEVIGVIETGFSNDPSPFCIIKTESGVNEIFLGEVLQAKLA